VTGSGAETADIAAADATGPSRSATLALLLAVTLLAAAIAGCGAGEADNFCTASGAGRTAIDAARAFVAACGSDYQITRGPYDADQQTTPFANYAQVAEFTISVVDNSEGSLGFLTVGRRTREEPWHTLEPLGSGP
jgi:hypothetical protein